MSTTAVQPVEHVTGPPPSTIQMAKRKVRFAHWGAVVALCAPFVILFVVFYLLPVAYAIGQSFFTLKRPSAFEPAVQVFAGFDQYLSVFQNGAFWESLGRVLLLLVTVVPISIALGVAFALIIDSPVIRGRRFFRLAFFAPYAVPGVISTIMWGFFYSPQLSPLPDLAGAFPLLEPAGVMFAIGNIIVWTTTGFNMLIMYSALRAIPAELYEAARIDGAGQLRTALSIKLPLIVPSIVMVGVLSIIGSFQIFNEPTVLRTISNAIGVDFTPNMLVLATANVPNYSLAAAFSVVLALSTAVLSFLFLRLTQKRAFQ